jgi:uncharacterized membrane protein YdjX (TVP38/TMEM64 family)
MVVLSMNWRKIGNIALAGLGVFVFIWSFQHVDEVIVFATNHPVLAPLLIICWRAIGIIIPPIPGGIVSIALIPVFGWFWSFIYASIGVLIGCSVAFFLARIYGPALVGRFVPLKKIEKWEKQISETSKFWAFLAIRFTTGPILDFVSYMVGLTKISFKTFFLATAVSLLPDALYYYLGEAFFRRSSKYLLVAVLVLVVIYYFASKFKVMKRLQNMKKLPSGRERDFAKKTPSLANQFGLGRWVKYNKPYCRLSTLQFEVKKALMDGKKLQK